MREVAHTVLGLTQALAGGDLDRVDAAFSSGNLFQSVGVSEPSGHTGPETNDRASLSDYLRERISEHETYSISKVTVRNEITASGFDGDVVRIDFLAIRKADDLEEPLAYRGWAEMDCPEKRIYLLNLGPLHPTENTDRWCPDTGASSEAVLIACSPPPEEKSLVGLHLCSVLESLKRSGIRVLVKRVHDGSERAGTILRSEPARFRRKAISSLTLTASTTTGYRKTRSFYEHKRDSAGFTQMTIAVDSIRELVRRLGDSGFRNIVVLPLGRPVATTVYDHVGGDLVAKTTYRSGEDEIGVTQVDQVKLPSAGKGVRVRGFDGIRIDQSVYWAERNDTIAISPGKRRYLDALTWRSSCKTTPQGSV